MRVLFCGDRHWDDAETIAMAFDRFLPSVVIEGGARGADRMARVEAEARAIPVETYPAEWKRYRRGAGPIRNKQMLVEGKPDLVVAFHNDLAKSKGTADMVRRASETGVQVQVFHSLPLGYCPLCRRVRYLAHPGICTQCERRETS